MELAELGKFVLQKAMLKYCSIS